MKIRILSSLCVVLVANSISVRAEDTPAQAAARAALEQKFHHMDYQDAESSNTSSLPAPVPSAESITSTANARNTSNAPVVQTAPPTAPGSRTSEVAPPPAAPAENTSAQSVALAALKQKMGELNDATTAPPSETNAATARPIITTIAAVHEASAAASPVIETPAVEIPAARTPAITSAAAAPASAAPDVATPVPNVSAAPVVVVPSAAVVPPAITGPAALPSTTPAAVAPPAPTLPSSSPGKARPTNELVTRTGKVYKNVEVERVAEDGIVISYAPVPGGWAMTKIAFQELSAEIRQQYAKP